MSKVTKGELKASLGSWLSGFMNKCGTGVYSLASFTSESRAIELNNVKMQE